MACCEKHDRMDLKLTSEEFLAPECGTPTKPDGERRHCCAKCPEQGQPLRLRPQFASNPSMMLFLTEEQQREVMIEAIRLGPLHVNIVGVAPGIISGPGAA
jgi:hypothetical protein